MVRPHELKTGEIINSKEKFIQKITYCMQT
jgi:hypothetical protein